MTLEALRQKKVALLGLGSNHFALLRYLLINGVGVTVLDQNPEVKKRFSAPENTDLRWQFGPVLEHIIGFDVLFRSPSIPWLSPELVRARENGVEVTSQTNFFLEHCPCRVVAVTGTKGKGTTASLIYEILKTRYTTYLAGNIGVDPFLFFDQLTKDDIVVLELSSFQTQDLKYSPTVGVLLRVTSDHLDHHKSIEEYRQAKYQLFAYQTERDTAIINTETQENKEFSKTLHATLHEYTVAHDLIECEGKLMIDGVDVTHITLLGRHNYQNIIPAILVGTLFEISRDSMSEVVRNFTPLPHRLQKVHELAGVMWVDDSIATTTESSISSIEAFPDRIIHLVAGGNSKGGDYAEWIACVHEKCETVSLLCGSMSEEVAPVLPNAYRAKGTSGREQMKDILSHMKPEAGSIVLLAPGATSFHGFTSYAERGALFSELAQQICD